MRRPVSSRIRLVAVSALLGILVPGAVTVSRAAESGTPAPRAGALTAATWEQAWPATPGAKCDKGSEPESVQGYVPPEDLTSGRAKRGYFCNARLVSYLGDSGGFRVERYVDRAGNTCAYYDSTRLLPADVPAQLASEGLGVYVVDMNDPAAPRVTATLTTPAMLSPHESLRVNQARGLLAAALGNPVRNVGIVDVYDISADCRAPRLASSTPLGVLGHESGFAPDGRTFYVASTGSAGRSVTALDLTDPALPSIVWVSDQYNSHGLSISDDGNTLYMADMDARPEEGSGAGLTVLDVAQVQQRVPNPQVTEISHLSWPEVSLPQNATPFVRDGHRYVLETDEFGGDNAETPVGAARIINVDDPREPYVVSRLRLTVHNMPGTGYSGHYCSLPSRDDPNIVACGFLQSGLRVFDIRDVANPREIAYANFPIPGSWLNKTTMEQTDSQAGAVYSAPAYDPVRNDIWYTDGLRGFYVLHLNASSGISRFAKSYRLPGN